MGTLGQHLISGKSLNEPAKPYHAFWGKTRGLAGDGVRWHPLAYHSLDVAAVGSVLLREHDFPAIDSALHPLLLTLLAWHDIGKFTRTFQCKVEPRWPASLGPFKSDRRNYGHDTAGYGLLTGAMEALTDELMPQWRNGGRALLRAATGHHGRPPKEIGDLSQDEACVQCEAAARDFGLETMGVVGGQPVANPGNATALLLAWQLAGLAVAADWIGSNETWFAACEAPMPLEQYWRDHALPQARIAVAAAGILPAKVKGNLTLSDLAPHATVSTPLQALAQQQERQIAAMFSYFSPETLVPASHP